MNSAPSSTTNMTGLRTISRGSSLRAASAEDGRLEDAPRSARRGCDRSVIAGLPVEREVELEHVDGLGAREPEERPARVVVDEREHPLERRCRARAATRLAWMRALASEMSGSTPEADDVTASDGIRAAVRPGVNGRSRRR